MAVLRPNKNEILIAEMKMTGYLMKTRSKQAGSNTSCGLNCIVTNSFLQPAKDDSPTIEELPNEFDFTSAVDFL